MSCTKTTAVKFVAAVLFAWCATTAQVFAGDLNIAANAESIQPINIGEPIPSFTVVNAEGEDVLFSAETIEQPTVFVTYRGGWCPYCNVQLQELRKVLPSINALGAEVVFLTGDDAPDIYSSLKEKTQKEIDGLNYTIYSDAQMDAASKLGIAFYVQQGLIDKLDEYGLGKNSSVEKHGALPVPSVFVVNGNGNVSYRFFDPDYKIRLKADELLQQVKIEIAKK